MEKLAKRTVQVVFWNAKLKFLRRLILILVILSSHCQNVRLPPTPRDQLLYEMESHVPECLKEVETDKMLLFEVIYACGLLANFMLCLYSTRSIFTSFSVAALVFLFIMP